MPRVSSMIIMLVILALIYSQARKPQTWSWLAGQDQQLANDAQDSALPLPSSPAEETIIPAATDLVPAEATDASRLFEAVSDRSPISTTDMPAYWRCLKWALAQSSADLYRRAQPDVLYTQLWEQPQKYRGKLLRLRLHVRRVLQHETPANSVGVSQLYEAWGVTDESRSHPYVVIFSELPPGLSTGADVRKDVVFVGYFLKTMSYTSADATRAAPLLAGRMMPQPAVALASEPSGSSNVTEWIWVAAVVALLAAAIGWRIIFRRRIRKSTARAPAAESDLEEWLNLEAATGEKQSQHVHTNGKE
ncbi:MAG: hypothetical protein WD648_08620 [Planctomycetaceae bacterium]